MRMTPQELIDLPHNTKVRVIEDYDPFFVGDIIYRNTIDSCDCEASCSFSELPDGCGRRDYMNSEEVELITEEGPACGTITTDFNPHMELFQPESQDHIHKGYSVEQLVTGCPDHTIQLGMFRPELESRKVGKIRVELVDHGFPLALREVAKVMTWAQTAKGYKDHDWQNLPNAEVALEAAASRHRTDHIEQRVVEGYLIERCVDHESGLLHKAHEAFGVLAQLELMLRGEFDIGLDVPS